MALVLAVSSGGKCRCEARIGERNVPAKVAFVLVDAEFDQHLAATLPGGLSGLMHGGPRD